MYAGMGVTHDGSSAERGPEAGEQDRGNAAEFLVGAARGFAGALLFALPLLMTMEMWHMGYTMTPWRMLLLVVLDLPLLVGLSYFSGFQTTPFLRDDVVDAFVAFAIGALSALVLLALFGLIGPGMSAHEILGKVILQAVPGSIGALFAQSQLGSQPAGGKGSRERRKYWGTLFLMAAGALFLSFNLAPTQEMIVIQHRSAPWQLLVLVALSLIVMHGFVYAVDFRGQARVPPGREFWSVFLRHTVVGYAVALLVSAYALWTFGRFAGNGVGAMVESTVVLGFPGAIGAAAARLIL